MFGFITSIFKARTVQIKYEKVLIDFSSNYTPSEDDVKYWVEQSARSEVRRQVEMWTIHNSQIDRDIVERLARELIANYDFKPAIEDVIRSKMKRYLESL